MWTIAAPIFGGLAAQVDWLGLRIGGHPALSLHSSKAATWFAVSSTRRFGGPTM